MCKPHERNNNKPVKQSFFFCINKACEVWKIILATEKTALTIGQNGDQYDRQSNIIIFFIVFKIGQTSDYTLVQHNTLSYITCAETEKKKLYLNFHLRLSCEYQENKYLNSNQWRESLFTFSFRWYREINRKWKYNTSFTSPIS